MHKTTVFLAAGLVLLADLIVAGNQARPIPRAETEAMNLPAVGAAQFEAARKAAAEKMKKEGLPSMAVS